MRLVVIAALCLELALAIRAEFSNYPAMDFSMTAWLIVAFLIGLVVNNYLPAYVRKKGENLATKEDTAAITREVESVKAAVSRQTDLFSAKQELLMRFYDEVTALYYERLSVNFGDFPNDQGKSLFEYQTQYYKSVAEITKAYQRLVIFLPPDSSLLKVAEEITKGVIETRKVLSKRFGPVKFSFLDEYEAYKSGDEEKLQIAVSAADDANSKFWDKMRPHVEAIRRHYQIFLREMNSYVADDSSA